jgi:hypothetical protein
MQVATHLLPFVPSSTDKDVSDALSFWLQNPLMHFHFKVKMEASIAHAATLGSDAEALAEKRRLLWAVRAKRDHTRASRRIVLPEDGLPLMSMAELMPFLRAIPEQPERGDVLRFARRLSDCERPWLAERLIEALGARFIDIPWPAAEGSGPEHDFTKDEYTY